MQARTVGRNISQRGAIEKPAAARMAKIETVLPVQPTRSRAGDGFFIVALGASAAGLEASPAAPERKVSAVSKKQSRWLNAGKRELQFTRESPHSTVEEWEKKFLNELAGGRWIFRQLRHALALVLTKKTASNDFQIEREFSGVGRKTFVLNGRRLAQQAGLPGLILLAMEAVTETKREGK